MGQSFRKMFDSLFGSREMRVVMLGERLGAQGRVGEGESARGSAVRTGEALGSPACPTAIGQQRRRRRAGRWA